MASDSPQRRNSFAEYKPDAHNWITLTTGEYYPDILTSACNLYGSALQKFGELLQASKSSDQLLLKINNISETWMRIQLLRIFRKYVSPSIPVEMAKKKSSIEKIIQTLRSQLRPIEEVQKAYKSRPNPVRDEALCAILWEYKDRGKKGYDLTENFFNIVQDNFPNLIIKGPKRAGRDISMSKIFPDYPNPNRPVDFVIYDKDDKDEKNPLAIGLARYDSDRGGAQEDDRTGQYANTIDEILEYIKEKRLSTKILLLNDGPGLLLGSMWDDYAKLEGKCPEKVMVLTLRMVLIRFTLEWLQSQ